MGVYDVDRLLTEERVTRRRFVAQLAGLAAGMAPVLSACSPSPGPTARAPAPTAPAALTGQGTAGGSLRTTFTAEPGTIDPHRSITTIDFNVRGALFTGLVEETPSLEVKPLLAESWEAPDAKTYTFKLRRGLKFHDGSEVNAEAVRASFTRATDPAVAPAAAIKGIADRVATITTPDPYTVRFEPTSGPGPGARRAPRGGCARAAW